MNNIELYLKALTRVSERHYKAETSRKQDWQELGKVYTDWLVGDLGAHEARAILTNVK
jgi:hypothetical protein